MAEHDAVIVGSGINSLACAALLARAGWSVCVLERNDWLGGAIKTAEITVPGFRHDVFSAWHPLWVGGAAHALLGDELAARGLEYLNTELPTACVSADGESAFLLRSTDANAGVRARRDGRRLAGVVDAFIAQRRPLLRRCLGPSSGRRAGARLGRKARAPARPARTAEFTGNLLSRAATGSDRLRRRSARRGLLAPWVLHTGLGPDAASSGFMTQVIAVAIQEGGMPVPRGGGERLAEALVRLIRDHGGSVPDRRARSTRSLVARRRRHRRAHRGGRAFAAARAVIANVTPTQLYGRLLGNPDGPVPEAGAAVPLRPLGDADPLRALRAAPLAGRRAARAAPRSST